MPKIILTQIPQIALVCLSLVFEFKQTFIESLKRLRLPLNANGKEYENMLILIKMHQVTRKYLGNQ